MDVYGVTWNKTGAENVACLVELLCDATVLKRARVHEFSMAVLTAASDATPFFKAKRVTNSGTGTTVAPTPRDPAAPAAHYDAEHLITADPASYAAGTELYGIPLNGRASFRWVAVDQLDEIILPATATNGIGLGTSAASTLTYGGSLSYKE